MVMEIRPLPKIAPGLRWLYPHLSYALPITNSNGSGLRPVAYGDGVSVPSPTASDARCGRKLSMLTTNISERGQPTCLECARDWAAGCAPHRMYWLVQALSRRLDGENVSEWLPHRRLAPPRYRRCLRLRICGSAQYPHRGYPPQSCCPRAPPGRNARRRRGDREAC